MQLRDGETVGDYISRLEARVKELEPPEGFTVQEWHIAQVFAYLLWRPERKEELSEWDALRSAFEKRFRAPTQKFADYMGWKKRAHLQQTEQQ